MLFHKWNWDEALEVRFEEGEAKGVAIGEARGMKKGEARVLELVAKGYSLERIKEILRHDAPLRR